MIKVEEKGDLLTIKEFAEASGRSQQTIYRQISTRLANYVKEIDGHKYIERSALTEVFNIVIQPGCLTDLTRVEQPIQPNHSTDSTRLNYSFNPQNNPDQPLYDILRCELEAKNKQIEELQRELAEERKHSREQSYKLAQLVDQAQRLHASTIQKQLPVPDAQKADGTNNCVSEIIEEPQKRRGFFDWIRGR